MTSNQRDQAKHSPAASGTSDGEDDRASSRDYDLNPVKPDAVSPQVRSDGDGAVQGGLTRDTGAGAAGGRDPGGPGGREPERNPGDAGRGKAVDSED